MKFTDLLPDELVKILPGGSKVNQSDMSAELENGSFIFFRGGDNADAQVGIACHGAVFTEAAMINPVFYDLMHPAISRNMADTGKGFVLFISTPRGVNWFAKLFVDYIRKATDSEKLKRIKDKWGLYFINYKMSVNHKMERLLSEDFIEEEKYKMGEDKFEQEYGCSFTASSEAVWYGRQLTKAIEDDRIKKYGEIVNGHYVNYYWKNAPVYISWDYGKRDYAALWFYQINPETLKPRYIHFHKSKGMGLEYYAEYIKKTCFEMNLGAALNIVPHDMNQQMDSNPNRINDPYAPTIKRIDRLRQLGLRCQLLDRKYLGEEKFRIINRINTVRKLFEQFEIDEIGCFEGVEALKGYVKKYNKSLNCYIDEPDHNANDNASDSADSLGYGVLYYEMNLMNKHSYKNKHKRSFKY